MVMRDIQTELNQNHEAGEKTLLWFYYAGHGVMKNLVFAVTCDDKTPYPLEKQLMILSSMPSCMVVGLFDCCRAPFPETHRGSSIEENAEADSAYQYIFYYGCPPNQTVPGKSTMAKNFFDQLKAKAHPYDGSVILPSSL